MTATSAVKCGREAVYAGREAVHTVSTNVASQCGIVTKGCTDPKRPNEHITIRYTALDGTTVYHDVLTDADGCFEDFFVTPGAGAWEVDTKYQGGDCTAPSRARPGVVIVPPFGGRNPFGGGKLLSSFHLGMSFPTGSFADDYDPGASLTVDLEYPFRDQWSLLIFAGYHQFDSDTLPNLGILSLNVDLKRSFPLGGVTAFAELGPGFYRAAGSTNTGANAGLGLHFDVLSNLAIEAAADAHVVNTKPREVFIDARLGIVWRF
jgi:hypothetical protein